MTIAQAERFYKQDNKSYELKKNKEFASWFKSLQDAGYHSYMNLDELQSMINTIANWYEMKYPERELEALEGTRYTNFKDVKSIADAMSIRQLLYRLPHNQVCLMECGYRAHGWGQEAIYENGKVVDWKPHIYIRINRNNCEDDPTLWHKDSSFLVKADYMTGEVDKGFELYEFVSSRASLYLEGLLTVFKEKYGDLLDYSELSQSVFDHQSDMELRNKLLQLVALKLLYSRNTTPERGYERARRFLSEFQNQLRFPLTTDEIDEAINRDYNNGSKADYIINHYIDENGKECSYRVFDGNNKNEKGIRQFVKKIFEQKEIDS